MKLNRFKDFIRNMNEGSTAAATSAIAMKHSLDRLYNHGRKKGANREDDLSKLKQKNQDEFDRKEVYDMGEEGMEDDMMGEEGMEDMMNEE